MEPLIKEMQQNTPSVVLDQKNNIFKIAGKSLIEDVGIFYKPIKEWIDQYAKSPNPKTKFVMKFTYLDTSSEKEIFDILLKLDEMCQDGRDVLVSWQYSQYDDSIYEKGKEYEAILDVPFEVVSD